MEFVKFRDLPRSTRVSFRLAMNFDNPVDRAMMEAHEWETCSALEVSRNLSTYQIFIQESRGEFTVAKEQNIVFQTGWFSDRAATYLAAGRPVLNQDTGFGQTLPTGAGLFSFRKPSDCVEALEAIEADYARHSNAAREIAHGFFDYNSVLPPLLAQAGLGNA